MPYIVEVREVESRLLGAVRARPTRATLVAAITGSPVWTLIRARGIANGGHNVVVYKGSTGPELDIEVGVDVFAPFVSDETLICTATPGGLVITTRHNGPYDKMDAAHAAIHAELARLELPLAGISWEWYGHWTDDPASLTTDIYYQLAADAGSAREYQQ